ncbi:uncharacterized protein N7518_010373 [Penicillium psychrosexuale]|uniref:uncharacterized protein n=1 Tax=Penicillium psychrosexuale TaxID=1002107 RepID=UPI0025454AA0|nr:uncharacterized protein N7518_010373 [Penicillium psychrosexuale]KAJ5781890.1 hypothetical protein N7518_010373 [Penicillium psychrosexuale]
MSAQYDRGSEVQTGILCDSPSENDPFHTSSSSQKDPSAMPNTFPGGSSDGFSSGGLDNSCGAEHEASSIDNIDTRPKSPPALFSPSSEENYDIEFSSTPDMSAQYDSDSDTQTVILCDSPSGKDISMLHISSSIQEEPSTISNTSADNSHDDFSDDSSIGSSDWYSSAVSDSSASAKSESSSIESFDKSSQHDAESEEEEEEDRPTGSQVLAAYASPLRDGQRVRTSCDSIHDPGQWQVDSDGFINEQNRAGGPYLCSLPVTIFNLDGKSPLWTVFETISLHKMILSVLEQYKVNATSIKIKKCQYKYWPLKVKEPAPTLIITATRDTFSDTWVQACRQIWQNLSENQLGHINVEITIPNPDFPFQFWPLESEHPYSLIYLQVHARIIKELQLKHWLDFNTLRIATTSDVKDSEAFSLLGVHFQSEQDWRGLREQIISILEECKLPMVGVMIQKGKRWGGGAEDYSLE